MIPIKSVNHINYNGTEGELRYGIASWDQGQRTRHSVKWAYPDSSGRISRGSPEVPIDILVEMVRFAYQQRAFSDEQVKKILATISDAGKHSEDATPSVQRLSKWALLAEKIHQDSPLNGHSADLLKLAKEFREDFTFKHDFNSDE